jgi:hypothetical protein
MLVDVEALKDWEMAFKMRWSKGWNKRRRLNRKFEGMLQAA